MNRLNRRDALKGPAGVAAALRAARAGRKTLLVERYLRYGCRVPRHVNGLPVFSGAELHLVALPV